MKTSKLLSLLFAGTISCVSSLPVVASSFGEGELDNRQFAVVAAPYHHGYNLLILEQIPGQRPCWDEIGNNPTTIDPLFLNFDFTNSCIRRSDSNSYSIRFEGKDYGLDYLPNIVKREGELHLVGTPRDSTKPELHIGKTNGFSSGSLKINLNPRWRLTKRTYGGQLTEHVYLSNSSETQVKTNSNPIYSQNINTQQNTSVRYQQSQPVNSHYPQQVYSIPQYVNPSYTMPQPVNGVYPQQPRYQPPQSVNSHYPQQVYSIPQYINPSYTMPQPVNGVYPQQVYSIPQYVNPSYTMPQPVNGVYPQQPRYQQSQPVNSHYPQHINYETQSLNTNYQQ